MDIPPRLEDTDPEIDALLMQISSGQHPLVKGVHVGQNGVRITRWPISAPEKIGRNDPCPCGSGKKYKKCCAP